MATVLTIVHVSRTDNLFSTSTDYSFKDDSTWTRAAAQGLNQLNVWEGA